MIGGGFLYLIAKKLVPPSAAILSTAFYLFVPYGVLASRSFQPDPLMVAALVFSIFTILRYYEQPSTRRLIVAAVVSALALLVKPGICLFLIFAAFVSLGVHERGFRNLMTKPHFVTFAILSVLPTVIYYWYGMFVAGFLQGQVQAKVMPHLLTQPTFWGFWLKQIMDVVGGTYLVGAIVGLTMLRGGRPRALMLGLWGGYVVFGLTFTYHIHTHDYYSLQLIPVVALSLGPVGALIVGHLGRAGARWYRRVATTNIVLLAGTLIVLAAIAGMLQPELRNPNAVDFGDKVSMYQEVGETVYHSSNTLYSAPDYGLPLQYHGWLHGASWPDEWEARAEQLQGTPYTDIEERFDALAEQYSPEYFIIVRDFWHFEQQKDLGDFLAHRYTLVAQDDDYWVFDLRERVDPNK